MEYAEFQAGVKKLTDQWPKFMSETRQKLVWTKWQKLPKGVFESAAEVLLYRGGHAPSGEVLDEAVIGIVQSFNEKVGNIPEKIYKACATCSHTGTIQVFNAENNSCVVACSCELGTYRAEAGHARPRLIALDFGYSNPKLPLSHKAKKHPEWIDADENKYSAKLIGIYNTVQRSMLMDDQRGMRGISLSCKINLEEAFKIYELMREGNITHSLIFKNNGPSFRNDSIVARTF